MKSIKRLLPQEYMTINPSTKNNWGKIVIKRGLLGRYTIRVFKGATLFEIDSKVFEASTWFSSSFIDLLGKVSSEFPSLKLDINLIIKTFSLD